jgi:hypothetical protein
MKRQRKEERGKRKGVKVFLSSLTFPLSSLEVQE